MKTLAHLSDLHFGRTDPAVLEPLRAKLHALQPHLIVVSGDLTQRARKEQFEEAVAYLESLPGPQLVVPGNHDVPLYNVVKRFLSPLGNYKRIVTDDLDPAHIDDEMAVVGVNTARSNVFKGGRINMEQVEAIKARLCGLPEGITKIVVTHHPFDAPKNSDEEDQIVGRAKKALQELAGCGADLLLAGHLHASAVSHTADRYTIAGLSALVVQAGTATSTRQRGEPNSFNVLRVQDNHIEVDRLVFNDTEFVVASTQAFDHDAEGWKEGAIHHG
jgi:3',5'-cyclic AMP phosphodiesterase CpdA